MRAFDAGALLIPKATYRSARVAPARPATASPPGRSGGPTSPHTATLAENKGKPLVLYDADRTWAATACRPWSRLSPPRRALGGEVAVQLRASRTWTWPTAGSAAGNVSVTSTSAAVWRSATAPATPTVVAARRACRWCAAAADGVIEASQEIANGEDQPTPLERRLGAADYTLVAHGRHDLFTFCTCAAATSCRARSEPGRLLHQRHESFSHDPRSPTVGLVVTIPAEAFGGGDVLAACACSKVHERRASNSAAATTCVRSAGDRLLAKRADGRRAGQQLPARGGAGGRSRSWSRRWCWRRCGTACRSWTGAGGAAFCRGDAGGAGGARAPVRIPRDDATRETPGLEGCTRWAEGRLRRRHRPAGGGTGCARPRLSGRGCAVEKAEPRS